MDDVKKDDVIYAKHFLQLENLYNAWCYGSPTAGGGDVIINGGIARSCWTSLSAAYGEIPAAGIMGNIAQESSFDPTADNGNHYGLCQWGCYFAEIYYDRPGWEKQLDYILNGQTSSYRTTCLNPTYAGYGSAHNILGSNFSAFLNASTPERAAMIWVTHYENAPGQ